MTHFVCVCVCVCVCMLLLESYIHGNYVLAYACLCTYDNYVEEVGSVLLRDSSDKVTDTSAVIHKRQFPSGEY